MERAGIALRAVRVRPVRPEEVPRWIALMRERHYLGFTKFCGPQLKQVAVQGERWLALLGWQAAVCAITSPEAHPGRFAPVGNPRHAFRSGFCLATRQFLAIPAV